MTRKEYDLSVDLAVEKSQHLIGLTLLVLAFFFTPWWFPWLVIFGYGGGGWLIGRWGKWKKDRSPL